jgi:hypothetical protein
MPKKKPEVITTFQKAGRDMAPAHPNAGKAHASKMKKTEPLSPIAQFVFEQQDPETGKPSTLDLYRYYKENECNHTGYTVLAKSGTGGVEISTCNKCGQQKVLGKK